MKLSNITDKCTVNTDETSVFCLTLLNQAFIRPMVTLFFIIGALIWPSNSAKAPNIIFMLIDDLGWNDVSFHGGCDFSTPHIDALQQEALTLNNYYVQHLCSPTRSTIMTGLYPIHTGLQHFVIRPPDPFGLPLNLTTLPEALRKVGYQTHILGVWCSLSLSLDPTTLSIQTCVSMLCFLSEVAFGFFQRGIHSFIPWLR